MSLAHLAAELRGSLLALRANLIGLQVRELKDQLTK